MNNGYHCISQIMRLSVNVPCPYCEQVDIWRVIVLPLDLPAFICAECDTIWLTREDIGADKGKNFGDFMAERGLDATWNNVVKTQQV